MSENNNEIMLMPLDETLVEQNEATTTQAIEDVDFITEENTDAFRLLSLKSKINDIQSMANKISNEQRKLLGEDEEFDPIDNVIKNFTEEQLKEMPFELINEILVDEDGDPIEFNIDFGGDENKLNVFKKEFLILRKQSLATFDKFDEEIANINKEIEESQEDFDNLVKTFGNVSNLIRAKLVERLEQADEDKKPLLKKLLDSFDNGLSLHKLMIYCRSYKGKNILGDYKIDKEAQYIYKRYLKVVESLNIKTDLTSFTDLEKRFLTEEYQNRPNIFMFAAIHFISSWHNKDYSKVDGLFITQFTVNLKNLYYDKFDNEDDKVTFIKNIQEVIKIIG